MIILAIIWYNYHELYICLKEGGYYEKHKNNQADQAGLSPDHFTGFFSRGGCGKPDSFASGRH